MDKIKIALAQLVSEDGNVDKNFKRVDEVVRKYGRSHDLMIFPETFFMGFPETKEECRRLAEPLDGPIVSHLKTLAKEEETAIAIGLYEKEGEEIYNTTVLVDPEGLKMSYRKTHLWLDDQNKVKAGNCFRSCDWQNTRVGVIICYDVEFPETARAVAEMGTELLIITDGNMEPYGHVHRTAIQARAQENQMYVAMANRVGKGSRDAFVGESVIADPYGNIIAEGGHGEEIVSATIDMAVVRESKQAYDYLKDRRIKIGQTPKEVGHGVWEKKI